jgi:hypothetical protein
MMCFWSSVQNQAERRRMHDLTAIM